MHQICPLKRLYIDYNSILLWHVLSPSSLHTQRSLPKDIHLMSINISNSILSLLPHIPLLPLRSHQVGLSLNTSKTLGEMCIPLSVPSNIIQEVINLDNMQLYPTTWWISINGTMSLVFSKFKRVKIKELVKLEIKNKWNNKTLNKTKSWLI